MGGVVADPLIFKHLFVVLSPLYCPLQLDRVQFSILGLVKFKSLKFSLHTSSQSALAPSEHTHRNRAKKHLMFIIFIVLVIFFSANIGKNPLPSKCFYKKLRLRKKQKSSRILQNKPFDSRFVRFLKISIR
jgi:hypothetical protein